MDYINFQYQISHQNNNKSGSHDEFHCYVRSHPYLLFYHLWLAAVPNFLHLNIPILPANVMKESNKLSTTTTSFSDVGNIGKKDKPAIKGQSKSEMALVLWKMSKQYNEILKNKTGLESEKHSFHLEHTLTELMKGHHESLTNERCKLLVLKLGPGFDSDASVTQETKKHIELFKKMYSKSFETLNSSSSEH